MTEEEYRQFYGQMSAKAAAPAPAVSRAQLEAINQVIAPTIASIVKQQRQANDRLTQIEGRLADTERRIAALEERLAAETPPAPGVPAQSRFRPRVV